MSTPEARLIALDLDGTLLRRDGSIADEDRAAISAARARGVVVTLATGRLTSSTMPLAQALDLDAPLVCADGAVLFDPTRGVPLAQTSLATSAVTALFAHLHARSLAAFWFTHEAVCGEAEDVARFPFVAGWTPNFVPYPNHTTPLAPLPGLPPITAIGVGPEKDVLEVEDALRADPAVAGEVITFPIRTTDHWVVRLTPDGCTKAVGLARLTRDLGITAAEVVAIGDWYNDLPMLAWAGQSFAMGHAPPEVQAAARAVLEATVETGGAVAEALSRLAAAPARVTR